MCQIDWNLVLEYLKVVLSWPPVTALLLVLFVRRFSSELSKLIDRVRGLKLPGGSEVVLNEIEQQQEFATPPSLLFPSAAESSTPRRMHADLTAPSPTLEMAGHADGFVDRTYTDRVRALYPAVNADAVVEWLHFNPGPSLDDYVDKVFQLQSERTFNIIFGTQILALVLMDDPARAGPVPGADFASLYSRHVELTGGSPGRLLSEFLGFLVVSGLAQNVGTVEGPLYQITENGREFLLYIRSHYPLQWNEKPF